MKFTTVLNDKNGTPSSICSRQFIPRKINPRLYLLSLLIFITAIFYPYNSACGMGLFEIREGIQDIIETNQLKEDFVCRGELICGVELIPEFYSHREYAPLWVDENGLNPSAEVLIHAIGNAELEGLNPEDYHYSLLKSLVNEFKEYGYALLFTDPKKFSDLDFLLTDAFLLYGSHLLGGRVNPETFHNDWVVAVHHSNLLEQLKLALIQNDIDRVIKDLAPPHAGYWELREALSHYLKLAEKIDLPKIEAGPTFQKGDTDDRVITLRKILDATGADVLTEDMIRDDPYFDSELEAEVIQFQKRHGLTADGLVGKVTRAALNVPIKERIRQIKINMERWRWMPHDLGKRYLWVNTAAYQLVASEENRSVMDMRVVVGRPARQTPVFSSRMTYLVVNPYWHIPYKIAVEDILPKIKDDPLHLISQNIRVFENWSNGAKLMEPWTIDWGAIDERSFRYKLRQDPGPSNALGRIKFIFPNKFSVYLHDTPNRSLFDRDLRTFSSGCIRLENPKALASYLLKEKWLPEDLDGMIMSRKHRIIRIPDPINVHLLYLTAWVDDEGMLQFRDDVYKRDRVLDLALRKRVGER